MKQHLDSDESAWIKLQRPILAGLLILVGIILTLTIVGALLGIPMMIIGLLMLTYRYV